MNYTPNQEEWKIGDLVIHDADAKKEYMLMKIVGIIETKSGKTYKTEYLLEDKKYRNKLGFSKIWCNPKECLHNPKRFDIDTS